jgi:hypothetical protein
MIVIVSYDLKAVRDYTEFYDVLKRQGTSWSHYLSSTWLLATQRTPQQIVEAVKPYMGPNDFILAGEFLAHNYFGWLPPAAWEWLSAQSQPMLPNFGVLPYMVSTSAKRE